MEEQQEEDNLDGRNEVGNIEGNNSGSENDVEDGSSTQTEIKELSEGNDNPKENTIRSKDKIAPKIINLKPNYGTINIPLTSAIEASFNEPVQKATIGPSTFLVKIPDGSMVSGVVSLSTDGKTAIFTPALLHPSTQYKVTISTGVKDLAGNTMASPENWSFTTIKDDTSSPNAGNQNVGDSIGLTVSNPNLDATKASGSLSGGSVGSAPSGSGSSGSTSSGVINDAITQQQGKSYIQILNDVELVDCILPLIVQKIDMKTLIAKADGRQLLEKVMPYLDIRLSSKDQASAISTVDISGLAGYSTVKSQTARCSEGEIISGWWLLTVFKCCRPKNTILFLPHKRYNMESSSGFLCRWFS